MIVIVANSVNDIDYFDFPGLSDIRQILSGIKLQKGKDYTDAIIYSNYKYIAIDSNNPENPAIALEPSVVLSDLAGYDSIYITSTVEGEIPVPLVAAWLVTAASALGASSGIMGVVGSIASFMVANASAIAIVANLAISVGLGAIMQAISPTKEFSSDPSASQAKKSSLFNGAPVIREQGGIVPLVLGDCFFGGVVIYSSLKTTAD